MEPKCRLVRPWAVAVAQLRMLLDDWWILFTFDWKNVKRTQTTLNAQRLKGPIGILLPLMAVEYLEVRKENGRVYYTSPRPGAQEHIDELNRRYSSLLTKWDIK